MTSIGMSSVWMASIWVALVWIASVLASFSITSVTSVLLLTSTIILSFSWWLSFPVFVFASELKRGKVKVMTHVYEDLSCPKDYFFLRIMGFCSILFVLEWHPSIPLCLTMHIGHNTVLNCSKLRKLLINSLRIKFVIQVVNKQWIRISLSFSFLWFDLHLCQIN